jgi:hypothetical protein
VSNQGILPNQAIQRAGDNQYQADDFAVGSHEMWATSE